MYLNPVAFLYNKAYGILHGSKSHFRTFRVNQDCNLVRYCPDIVHDFLCAFDCGMGRIDACYVHSVEIKLADELSFAIHVRYRADYFSLFLFHNVLYTTFLDSFKRWPGLHCWNSGFMSRLREPVLTDCEFSKIRGN